MKSIITIFILTILISTLKTFACDKDGNTGFLPENDLKISVNAKSMRNNMTERRFNQIIHKVDVFYRPIIKEKGGRLVWKRKWNDDTVNASAERGWFNARIVNLYGGLARHELVTDDAFALVICHELGHHIGGIPVKSYRPDSTSEGQSDYFATLKCFRRVFESEDNQEVVSQLEVPEIVSTKCKAAYTLDNDIALCVRSVIAGKSLADLLSSLSSGGATDFSTPDTSVVAESNSNHPAAQCRLDTYFAGALCTKSIEEDVSFEDVTDGTCNRIENLDIGARPLCWYKPRT